MRAVVWQGTETVVVEEVPAPAITDPHSAVVRVLASSICGSDLHLYHAKVPVVPGTILGHEAVGIVEAVGERVERVRVGDRVLISAVVGCGLCQPCRALYPVGCETISVKVFGVSPLLPGTQAEKVVVPYADFNVWPLPPEFSDLDALLLTDIFPTGLYAADNARVSPGDVVAVIGCGPVGLCAIQCAHLLGAAMVVAVDQVAERLRWATRFGAQAVANEGNVVRRVQEVTGEQGVDAVIEAVGSEETLRLALDLVRAGGRISMVGVLVREDVHFPLGAALLKDVTVRVGLVNVPRYLSQLFALVRNERLRPREMVTHTFSLSDAPRAYALFDRKEDGCLKVCLRP
ncbi:putative zinc-binding alcohol dehydrogenase [bacterium HR30]|nr:putative zinc-binding alcohol dehydrogenase [bacterium HR30]